ncbi:MAG: DUF1428 domain-containing protein [Pseudomonadota bacterium]
MAYIEGFVIPVPTADKQAFIDFAYKFDTIFKEHGASRILECWEEDVAEGTLTDFRKSVQAKPDESIVFSWIEWPDKQTRDAAMEILTKDPRFDPEVNPMPFDGKRMIFGGFLPVVEI